MKRPSLSPETLVAQGLGGVDKVTGASCRRSPCRRTTSRSRTAPITRAGSTPGPTIPTYEQAERLLAALEGGAGRLLPVRLGHGRGHRRLPVAHARRSRRRAEGAVLGRAQVAGRVRPAPGASTSSSSTRRDLAAVAAAHPARRDPAVWVETPANPTWEITDIAAVCRPRARGRAPGSRWTTRWPTPVLTRPIELGADLVMHSATKYLNGHSDVLAGALVTRPPTIVLAAHHASWRRDAGADARTVRGVAAAARHAHAVPARAAAPRRPRGDRRAHFDGHPARRARCSIPACRRIRATRSRRAR